MEAACFPANKHVRRCVSYAVANLHEACIIDEDFPAWLADTSSVNVRQLRHARHVVGTHELAERSFLNALASNTDIRGAWCSLMMLPHELWREEGSTVPMPLDLGHLHSALYPTGMRYWVVSSFVKQTDSCQAGGSWFSHIPPHPSGMCPLLRSITAWCPGDDRYQATHTLLD